MQINPTPMSQAHKIIETTKGQIPYPKSSSKENQGQQKKIMVLFAQNLNPQPNTNGPAGLPLTLESLGHHKMYPQNLENSSVSWSMIDHELQSVLSCNKQKSMNHLIFDISQYNMKQRAKLPEIFDKYQVVKGYNYGLPQGLGKGIVSEQLQALLTYQHVLKQIEMEFSLGNGLYRPGFIGEIEQFQCQNSLLAGVIKAYFKYSTQLGCPIVFNFLNHQDQQPFYHLFTKDSQQIISKLTSKLKAIENMLSKAKQSGMTLKKIILYNLPITFILEKKETEYIQKNYFQKHLEQFIDNFQVVLGFNLLRYSKSRQTLNQIVNLAQKYPENVIISSSIRFKTDLRLFSGEGLSVYEQPKDYDKKGNILTMNSANYIQSILSANNFEKVLCQNIIRLMEWKQKKVQIKPQLFWLCDSCKKQTSEKIKAFGKFGKQFCSMKCLRQFKE